MDLQSLNDRQKEAVLETEGPVMVIAGAGSGKTRVLTYRIAYLIELGISANSILAVTFTNKAAQEMKDRVYNMVGDQAKKLWVSTFHSMGARILREYISYLGYPRNFEILDEDDSLSVIKDLLKALNIDSKEYPPRYVKTYISKKKNKDSVSIDENKIRVLDLLYNNYQSALMQDGVLDFDDLLLLTYRLFTEYPQVLGHYQELFQYILVDEFQDTNTLQYELIGLLAAKHKNIFIVGDQDQSIYSWRGAKVENINYFLRDYKGCKQIILNQNYRSTQNILNVANCVIKNNCNRVKKELFCENGDGALITFNRLSSSYEETTYIVSEIDRLIKNGYHYSDIAIFYRANAMSRNLEEIFNRMGVPYVIYGGVPFFSRREIKDLIAYLRLLVNPSSPWAFKRVYNVPKRGIGKETFSKLVDYAYANNLPFMEAIGGSPLPKASMERLFKFRQLIMEMKEELPNLQFKDYVDFVIRKTGYDQMLKEEGDEGEDRLDNIKEFKSIMANAYEFYEGSDIEKLESLLNELALKVDTDYEPEEDSVKMMTYHQAKGLEFDIVFMMAMEENVFPPWSCALDPKELEEERRVCYVGITRARKLLYLTCAESRMLYGETKFNRPSSFIMEIDTKYVNNLNKRIEEKKLVKKTNSNETIRQALSKAPKTSFAVGDKINHQAFGDGVIVQVANDIITVAFEMPYGIKKLLSTHPSIRKL